MIDKCDRRDALRIEHITPLQIKDRKSGEIYEARMFNYSNGGIYFESDGIFEKGTPIYIGLHNSPYSVTSKVFEYYKGEVMWRKELIQSFFNYGYGIQLVSGSSKQDLNTNDAKKEEDLRMHPRKAFFQKIRFSTHRGTSEGITKNISASGVFIATEEKLEAGQLLKLNLPLKAGETKKIIGEIVWVSEEGFGLKFIKIK